MRSRASAPWLAGCFVGLAIFGCKKHDSLRQDESVQVLVEADRKLAEKERHLLAQRNALQRRRVNLREKRADLIAKQMALAIDDRPGREALQLQVSELERSEAGERKREIELNRQLEELLEKQSGLVKKFTPDDPRGKEYLMSRREFSLARRERDLSRREGELARREKVLASREQRFTERQAKMCPTRATVVQTMAAPPAKKRSAGYKRSDVETVYRGALSAMRSKGILTADLPPGIDRLVTETRHAVSEGDYARAKYAADQLLEAVRGVRIDRSFIGAKIERLAKAIRRHRLRGAKKTTVQGLFQQATASYGDGRFTAANKKLNRIYALIL